MTDQEISFNTIDDGISKWVWVSLFIEHTRSLFEHTLLFLHVINSINIKSWTIVIRRDSELKGQYFTHV